MLLNRNDILYLLKFPVHSLIFSIIVSAAPRNGPHTEEYHFIGPSSWLPPLLSWLVAPLVAWLLGCLIALLLATEMRLFW